MASLLTPLAATPPMGWNSWNMLGSAIHERAIRETADALVSSGLQDCGYEYIVIDDCWSLKGGRDADGNLAADPEKFPNGIKALADYVQRRTRMTVSVQSLASEQTREVAKTLIALAAATPEDRLNWQPLDNGRAIMDQLIECTLANQKWTNILRSRVYTDLGQAAVELALAELTTLDSVAARLHETAADLAAAIEAVPDADLAQAVETPWGPYSLARSCTHAYWNMVYHEGQINYVQTLYGDFDEHDPE